MIAARKPYEVLLLDVDDTLLDWGANEQASLRALFAAYGHPFDESAEGVFRAVNTKMWSEYEAGALARDELLNTRFAVVFERLGRRVDGREAEALYRESLNRGTRMIDGAAEICAALSGAYTLCVVSNGSYETQMRRLEGSGLYRFFSHLFISEKVGSPKPSGAFFSRVFAGLPEAPPETMLIIGDSLEADMRGGHDAGIDTCWFNPRKLTNTLGIPVTYEITRLDELRGLLPHS